jgi:hypothetical protein
MSLLQANLRTSELLSSVLFRVTKCLLLTVLFVSKAADLWVVVDGLLSWCSFHFQLHQDRRPTTTTHQSAAFETKRTVSNKHFGTPKSTLDKKFTGSNISLKMTHISRNMSL